MRGSLVLISGASRLHQAGWLTLQFCSAPPGADGGSRAGLGGVPGAEFIPGVSGCDLNGRRKTGTGRCLGADRNVRAVGDWIWHMRPAADKVTFIMAARGHSVWAPKLLGTEQGGPVGAAPPGEMSCAPRSSGPSK